MTEGSWNEQYGIIMPGGNCLLGCFTMGLPIRLGGLVGAIPYQLTVLTYKFGCKLHLV